MPRALLVGNRTESCSSWWLDIPRRQRTEFFTFCCYYWRFPRHFVPPGMQSTLRFFRALQCVTVWNVSPPLLCGLFSQARLVFLGTYGDSITAWGSMPWGGTRSNSGQVPWLNGGLRIADGVQVEVVEESIDWRGIVDRVSRWQVSARATLDKRSGCIQVFPCSSEVQSGLSRMRERQAPTAMPSPGPANQGRVWPELRVTRVFSA